MKKLANKKIRTKGMESPIVSIEAQLTWFVAQDKKSGLWVADCPVLKIVAQGETYSQLMESIDSCLQALFSDLVSTGELEQFLREQGWRLASPMPRRRSARVRFDIPYDIQRRSAHDLQAVCG